MRSPRPRSRRVARQAAAVVLATALAVIAACLGLACGGDDDDQAPTADRPAAGTLLERAFSRAPSSADVELDAQLQVDGLKGLDAPLRLHAEGVYVKANRSLPGLDLDVEAGNPSAGQTIQSGFLSTGSRAFLKFGGELYEQPPAKVRRVATRLRQGKGREAIELHPGRWIASTRLDGEEDVAGVASDHVTGRLAVRRMLADLDAVARRSQGAVGVGAPRLSASQLDRLAAYVGEPTFDVYVGKRDGLLRRMSTTIELDVPEDQRQRFDGAEGGSLRVTLELAKVGGDQRVVAPARARPISDLAKQLGGLNALRQGLDGTLGSGQEPDAGRDKDPAADPRSDALRRYSECLDRAPPSDTRAITRCRDLLR